MELQSRKRMRPSVDDVGRDRLSEMPDEVIVHILSCLPILDAVRTVLLRCFGNLWTLVHTLELDMLGFVDHLPTNNVQRKDYAEERFHNFVRNVLILHKRLSINKFHVRVKLHYPIEGSKAANEMKTWLRFALGREAKEINLCCKSDYIFMNSSVLPDLTSQSLVTLELASCNIKSRFKVNLPSLKKLLLDRCVMSNEELQRFISGCPFLQELVIKNPWLMDKLSFSDPNIDKLSLVITNGSKNAFSLDCPNLKTLYFEMKGCWLDIIDVSSVSNVFVKILTKKKKNVCVKTIPSIPDIDMYYLMGMWFYKKFGGAEVIHLSPDTSLAFLDKIRDSYVELKWKHVLLELKELCPRYLEGIYRLMTRLIYLEKLTIYTGQDFKARSDLHPSEVSSFHVPRLLKTIVLYGYAKSWKSQLQLVEFLLKHAAGLNELFIISIKRGVEAAEELEFVKSVSRFPRASPRAKGRETYPSATNS